MTAASDVTSPKFHGRIAQTLFWILLFVSLVPLLSMAGIAYLRARSLLHDQIFSQLSAVVQAQGQRLESDAATGQLLLTNALYEKDVTTTLDDILGEKGRNSQSFIADRNFIFDSLQSVNQPSPYYNQFLVVRPDGVIQIATHREWEGQKLPPSLQASWQAGKAITIASNDLQPFYEPQTLTLVSIIPYRNRDGATVATLIGFAESAIIQEMVKNAAFYASNQYFVSSQGQFYELNPYADIMNKLALMTPSDEQKEKFACHCSLHLAAISSNWLDGRSHSRKRVFPDQLALNLCGGVGHPVCHPDWPAALAGYSTFHPPTGEPVKNSAKLCQWNVGTARPG